VATDENEAAAVGLGLRVGVAATICLVVSEVFQLDQASLSVYTTHLVMSQTALSVFQKGMERIVGRLLGVLYGVGLVLFLRDTPLLYLLLMALGQVGFCYVHLSGRLAYAALNGALFVGALAAIGIMAPATAVPYAWNVAAQLVLGVGTALLVNAVTGADRTTVSQPGGGPLFPLRADWLNKSAMLATAQVGALLATVTLELPVTPTLISALILGVTPGDAVAIGKKGWQRTVGALLGSGYALAALILLGLTPAFPLLVALVFVGMFLASYGTRTSKTYTYAFLQMGLVVPMALVGAPDELGSITKALQRLEGIAAGLLIAEFVVLVWPQSAAPPAPPASGVSGGSTASSPGGDGTRPPG
jgi:uncharacterized membrane protein YgaE (UPF0421/DUF939 family)